MAFIRRLLKVTFTKAQGTFAEANSNQVTLPTNLWMSAQVQMGGAPSAARLTMSIDGMTLSLMNQLATLGLEVSLVQRNTITLSAITDQGAFTQIFYGTITNAYSDFQDQPRTPFRIEAQAGLFSAVQQAKPNSYTGGVDAATICQNLSTQMGLNFENNGINVKLNNPYLWGTLRDQAFQCAQQGNFFMGDDDGTLAIWPKSGSRMGTVPVISPDDGSLVKYPTFYAQGIIVQCIFNPNIKRGGQIQVKSSILSALAQTQNNPFVKQKLPSQATGTWTVATLNHNLDTAPAGHWFSMVQCYNSQFQPTSPVPVI